MDLTPNLPLHHVVALAVLRSGGAERYVDTEDVAVEANRIAPGRFTWRKYADQINLELIRVSLSDAKKAPKGALLIGSGTKGWRLSVNGIEWVRANSELLERLGDSPIGAPQQKKSASVETTRIQREKKRIQGTNGWAKWKAGSIRQLLSGEAEEVFRIDSYTTGNLIDIKVSRLVQLFESDEELSSFLKAAYAALRSK